MVVFTGNIPRGVFCERRSHGATVSLYNKTEEEIIGFITKKAFVEKLLIEERTRVPDKDKKAVRDVMKEVFQATTSAEDEDTIMKNFQRYAQNAIHEMERLSKYSSPPLNLLLFATSAGNLLIAIPYEIAISRLL